MEKLVAALVGSATSQFTTLRNLCSRHLQFRLFPWLVFNIVYHSQSCPFLNLTNRRKRNVQDLYEKRDLRIYQ